MLTNDETGAVMSRRDMLKRTGALSVGLLAAVQAGCGTSNDRIFASPNVQPDPAPSPTISPTPPGPKPAPAVGFIQPEVRRSVKGSLSVPMRIEFATNEVGTPFGVKTFTSRTFNGTLAPPTIRIKPGDHLEIPIENRLTADNDPLSPFYQGPVDPPNENTPHEWNTTNMHTHGLHISPSQDNVLLQILPGSTYIYKYDLPSDHPAGTLWYHPHKHGGTAMQLFSGMIGALIIEGGLDDVPEIAAAADLVFNINELNLTADQTNTKGAGIFTNQNAAEYFVPNFAGKPFNVEDSFYVVNGEYQPRMTVRPGQLVRLRILNASARGATPLTITGATNDWNIIAFDGLTLPETLTNIPEFTLQPANRADVLVRFDSPGTFQIEKKAFSPGGGGALAAQVLAYIDVVGDPFPQDFPSGPLPVSPTLPDITAGEVTQSRTLSYNTSPTFSIGATPFSSSTINQTIPLGSVIEWTLLNTSNIPHPHHIHIQDFQVVATSDGLLNGIPFSPPNNPADPVNVTNFFSQQVWMDTIGIPPKGWVRLRQRFPDFPGLFVLHCHILTHEDQGMMQLVNVV